MLTYVVLIHNLFITAFQVPMHGVPGCLSILFLKVEGVVSWSTANKMPRKVPKENKLNVISNKASQTHGPCQ